MTVKVKVEFDAKGNFKVLNDLDKKIDNTKKSSSGASTAVAGLAAAVSFLGVAGKAAAIAIATVAAPLIPFAFVVNKAVDAAVDLENALTGLRSVARNTGSDVGFIENAAKDLAKDGLIPLTEVSTSLKALMASGLSAGKAVETFEALRDAASFNRQGQLSLGEAVSFAADGIKNQNSVLVDNAGITKNISVILKEYARSVGKSVEAVQGQERAQAIANGVIKEAALFQGNYNTLLNTFSGASSKASGQFQFLLSDFGTAIIQTPQLVKGISAVADIFAMLRKLVNDNRDAISAFTSKTIKFILDWGAIFLRTIDKIINGIGKLKEALTPKFVKGTLGYMLFADKSENKQFGPPLPPQDSIFEKMAKSLNAATTIKPRGEDKPLAASKPKQTDASTAAIAKAETPIIDAFKKSGLALGANILKGAEGASALLGGVADIFLPGLGGIVTELAKGPEHVEMMIQEFAKALPLLISNIIRAIPVVIRELVRRIPEIINAIIADIPRLIEGLIDAIPDIIQALIDGIPIFIQTFSENIGPIIEAFTIAMVKASPEIAFALAKAMAFEVPKAVIESLIPGFDKFGSNIGESATQFFKKIVSGGEEFFKKIIEGAKEFLSKLVDGIKDALSSLTGGLIGGSGGSSGGVLGTIGKIASPVTSVVGSIAKKFKFADGADIPRGFDNDSFGPAFLSSGEAVITRGTTEKLNDFVDNRLPLLENGLMLLADAITRPMTVNSSVELNQREFANIILNLSRTNTRIAI